MAPYGNYLLSSDHSSVNHPSALPKSSPTRSHSENESSTPESRYPSYFPTTTTISVPPRPLHPSVIPQTQEQQQTINVMTGTGQNERMPSTSDAQIVSATPTQNTSNTRCNDPPLLITEAIHPNKYKMKQQRRDATAVGIVSGAVIGTMVLPVLGTAVGGAVAGYACNTISKQGERRAQRRWEQTSFRRQALQSHAVNAVYV
jgi:uncharacterized protein YcfJ